MNSRHGRGGSKLNCNQIIREWTGEIYRDVVGRLENMSRGADRSPFRICVYDYFSNFVIVLIIIIIII